MRDIRLSIGIGWMFHDDEHHHLKSSSNIIPTKLVWREKTIVSKNVGRYKQQSRTSSITFKSSNSLEPVSGSCWSKLIIILLNQLVSITFPLLPIFSRSSLSILRFQVDFVPVVRFLPHKLRRSLTLLISLVGYFTMMRISN